MDYIYRVGIYGGIYRKSAGMLAEEFNFKTNQWEQTDAAAEAFYMGENTIRVSFEEIEKEIASQRERFGE